LPDESNHVPALLGILRDSWFRENALAYHGGVDSIASTKVEDISRAVPYVRRALDALATGGPIDPSVTRPYGCPVPII
jgi:hypothetical protein